MCGENGYFSRAVNEIYMEKNRMRPTDELYKTDLGKPKPNEIELNIS